MESEYGIPPNTELTAIGRLQIDGQTGIFYLSPEGQISGIYSKPFEQIKNEIVKKSRTETCSTLVSTGIIITGLFTLLSVVTAMTIKP